jgi:hypothetical protein
MKGNYLSLWRIFCIIILFNRFVLFALSQNIDYLGQAAPGNTPVIFAPAIVISGLHTPPVFSYDGKEIYYKNMSKSLVTSIKNVKGKWANPEDISFSASLSEFNDPSISGDGNKLFFTSSGILPGTSNPSKENIWYMEKGTTGWGAPQPLDIIINSIDLHWKVSNDKNGNLYFSSIDLVTHEAKILVSKYSNGKNQKPAAMSGDINLKNCMQFSPYISPDGDYIIFDRSAIVNGQGEASGLMVSFRNSDSSFSTPQYLFTSAQFKNNSRTAHVSPDGKYLFFISWYGKDWQTYWVSTNIIEQKRPAEIKKESSLYPMKDFQLFQNFPNPFNPFTTIKYYLKNKSDITLKIYNLAGALIKTLLNETMESGNHSLSWDGTDNKGSNLPSGIYLYRLMSTNCFLEKKALLIK